MDSACRVQLVSERWLSSPAPHDCSLCDSSPLPPLEELQLRQLGMTNHPADDAGNGWAPLLRLTTLQVPACVFFVPRSWPVSLTGNELASQSGCQLVFPAVSLHAALFLLLSLLLQRHTLPSVCPLDLHPLPACSDPPCSGWQSPAATWPACLEA